MTPILCLQYNSRSTSPLANSSTKAGKHIPAFEGVDPLQWDTRLYAFGDDDSIGVLNAWRVAVVGGGRHGSYQHDVCFPFPSAQAGGDD